MTKSLITIITLIYSFTLLNAQPKEPNISFGKNIKISGKVVDKDSNYPLEYATIAFFSKSENKIVEGSITDAKGEFNIKIPQGTYDISIEYISYKKITFTNKNLVADQNLGIIPLEINFETLDAIEVIAERTTVEIRLDKKIYNVGKDLTVSGGNVSDVLNNVPSVSVDAQGTVSLRGNDNVRILINGKPSGLVGLNSADALRQLPAEAIEKVEVITSPSARYEAEGTAGILNIILRRSKLQGFNGSATTNIGNPNSAGLSGNVNYRTGDINFFNTSSYRYNESIGRWYNDVKYFDINTPDLDEKRNWTDIRKGLNTNFGLEWYVNDSASLTTSILYSNSDNENNSVNNLVLFDKTTGTTTRNVRLDPEKGDDKTIQYSLNFTKNFKNSNHKLTFDFQYENSNDNENSQISVNGIDTDVVTTLEDNNEILLQSDYVLPLGEMSQIEIGYRGDFDNTTTDYKVLLFNETSDEFELNSNLSNILNFKQYITAAYIQFGSKINKFSYLLGMRMENTRTIIDQPTSGDFKRKNLTGFFPTINLNYEISDNESIMFGFNRRLRRPRGFMLNPFPSRSSLTNVFQGNPDLDPTYTGKFEIGYLNKFSNFTLSSAIYYEHSTNVLTFVSRETGETVTINGDEFPIIQRGPINLTTDNRYGFEFNLNYSPSKKWRVNTDFNLYKFERNGSFNDIDLSANNLTWSARLTNKYTLPYQIDWQTNMNYRGPSMDAQNDRKGTFSTDTALSKDLFKDNASLAFNIRDIFNSGVHRNDITADTFTSYQEIQFRGGRTYNLSFTYRFNQKKTRERTGGFGGGDMEM
jgi:outer membrane receptor protein involved in Fe transport